MADDKKKPEFNNPPDSHAQPPRQDADKIDDTIDPKDEVDESMLETFPASDPPNYSGAAPSQGYVKPEDQEKKDK